MNATTDFLVLFSFEDMTLKAIINDIWVRYIRTDYGGCRGQTPSAHLYRHDRRYRFRSHWRRAAEAVACVRKFAASRCTAPTPRTVKLMLSSSFAS